MIVVTGAWSFILLGRDTTWLPWLRWLVLIGSVAGAVLLAISTQKLRRLAVVGLLVGSLTALSGTTAYTLATAATPHSGSIPTSGPTGSAMGGPGGAAAGGFTRNGRTDGTASGSTGTATAPDGTAGQAPGATGGTAPGMTGGTAPGTAGGTGGGPGGGSATTNSELVALLEATTTRWAAATTGAQSAAGYILGTDKAIMGIGGFTGSDPAPTVSQLAALVAEGKLHYVLLAGSAAGGPGGGGSSEAISTWVKAHGAVVTAVTVSGGTLYRVG